MVAAFPLSSAMNGRNAASDHCMGSTVASATLSLGPANIITEDPSCAAWGPLIDNLAETERNGWDKIDRAIPSTAWTADQRKQHDDVASAMRRTADHAVDRNGKRQAELAMQFYSDVSTAADLDGPAGGDGRGGAREDEDALGRRVAAVRVRVLHVEAVAPQRGHRAGRGEPEVAVHEQHQRTADGRMPPNAGRATRGHCTSMKSWRLFGSISARSLRTGSARNHTGSV
mgnify:CR=1 FL=1